MVSVPLTVTVSPVALAGCEMSVLFRSAGQPAGDKLAVATNEVVRRKAFRSVKLVNRTAILVLNGLRPCDVLFGKKRS